MECAHGAGSSPDIEEAALDGDRSVCAAAHQDSDSMEKEWENHLKIAYACPRVLARERRNEADKANIRLVRRRMTRSGKAARESFLIAG